MRTKRISGQTRCKWLIFSIAMFGAPAIASQLVGSIKLENGEAVRIIQTNSGDRYYKLGDILVRVDPSLGIGTTPNSLLAFVNLWPQAVVYVTFDVSVSSSRQTLFMQTVKQWSDASAVQFIQSTGGGAYITVFDETSSIEGGSSIVGYSGKANQPIQLARWDSVGILHEVGHALGLFHEHQRSDRDSFVTLVDQDNLRGNCPSTWAANFDTKSGLLETAYDFASVMHYYNSSGLGCLVNNTPTSFTTLINTNPGVKQPDGAPPGSNLECTSSTTCNNIMGFGENNALSSRDKLGMAKIYGYRLMQSPNDGNGSGTVSMSGDVDTCGVGCFRYLVGATATITAVPNTDSIAYITGICSGHSSCTASVNLNGSFHVRFVKRATIGSVISVSKVKDQIFYNGFN